MWSCCGRNPVRPHVKFGGRTSAFHMLALVSMGLPILDWPALTELAETCDRLARWDFLLTTAPLRLPGGTSSPLNPLCTF
jgi:hypothetical protein